MSTTKKKINLNDLQLNNIGGWPREAQLVFCGLVALLIVVSFSITLAPSASDYTRYLPASTSGRTVFGSVFGGFVESYGMSVKFT